jgi:hypothetical protein
MTKLFFALYAPRLTRMGIHVLFLPLLWACTPTVQLQAPDKPIEINLNVNIEHHIKVEIDKDVKSAISHNPDIF